MKPAAKTHVPRCEAGEMTKEQQAAIDRYREGVAERLGLSADQRRAMELTCPVANRDDTVR